jgi:hypothetical protein
MEHVSERREVFRADDPTGKYILDTNTPEKAVSYYYQIRSNLIHRGKGVVHDHARIEKSLKELLAIFRQVLSEAFKEGECLSARG